MTPCTIEHAETVELVALVLGMRPADETVIRLASTLSQGWLSGPPLAEIAREGCGVGNRRLVRLEASVELGRRALHARAARRGRVVGTPEDVAEIMRPLLVGVDQERFFALALNTKNMLLRVIPISSGSINASIVAPSILYRDAIQIGAASLIACHGHPSGSSQPSSADVSLTRRLVKAGDVLGVELLDHVVLGHGEHSSLRELGLM
ncbi:MAG TPA: JAB domain-containing protein [Coriobacteriia bacterium]